MAVPISFNVFSSEDDSLWKKLKVWFQIPNQFQRNLPFPPNDSIKMEDRKSIIVSSLQFGGYVKEADCVAHATQQCMASEGTAT